VFLHAIDALTWCAEAQGGVFIYFTREWQVVETAHLDNVRN
jgi:hypothetical protein